MVVANTDFAVDPNHSVIKRGSGVSVLAES